MLNARFTISTIRRDGEFRLILESDSSYKPEVVFLINGEVSGTAPDWLCLVASHIASEPAAVLMAYLPGDANIVSFPESELLGTEVLIHENIVEDLYGNYYVRLRDNKGYAEFGYDANSILRAIGEVTAATHLMDSEVVAFEALVSSRAIPLGQPNGDLASAITYRYDTTRADLATEPDGEIIVDDDGKIDVIPDEQTEAASIAADQEEWIRECDDNGIPTDADGMAAISDRAAEVIDDSRR